MDFCVYMKFIALIVNHYYFSVISFINMDGKMNGDSPLKTVFDIGSR